jgi:hypothetical protein
MSAKTFRRAALSLSDVVEGSHQGHADFRVGKPIFATLGDPDCNWGMVKLTVGQQAMLVDAEPDIFRPLSGGWGKQGSTQARQHQCLPREGGPDHAQGRADARLGHSRTTATGCFAANEIRPVPPLIYHHRSMFEPASQQRFRLNRVHVRNGVARQRARQEAWRNPHLRKACAAEARGVRACTPARGAALPTRNMKACRLRSAPGSRA